jgi:hypothetical protein
MSDKYKLMRIREGELDFELLIFGSIDECKDYQEHDKDEEEYEYCCPQYKIIPLEGEIKCFTQK